jgi:membrane-associated phospholipid phosphatase
VAGYAVAFTTGYLRMYNNKHWLSDVVAGAGVGILSTDLAYFLYPKIKKFFVKEKSSSTMAIPFYYQGIIGLSFVHQF